MVKTEQDVVERVVEVMIQKGELTEDERATATKELRRALRIHVGTKMRKIARLVDAAISLRKARVF